MSRFEAQKLHEVDEIKTRFFTNISHEFRTPLTLILGPAKQLLDRTEEEKTRVTADLIHRSALKLKRLVDELLDISKIESGEMKLKACPVNLVSVLKEITLSFSSLAERKKINYRLNWEVDKVIAYIDRTKINKIFSNLLSNAFKFTPEGGEVEVSIKITSGKGVENVVKEGLINNNHVCISVRDTGIGIPRDQMEKIFDRFYQVDSQHTREYEGTGIGLSLTKELVELHHGKIEVESEEGKGSTFRILIPLGKTHLRPEEICEEKTEKVTRGEPQKGQEIVESEVEDLNLTAEKISEDLTKEKQDRERISDKEKPLLLIVEDNPDVRSYITEILNNQYRINIAKDGMEGLDRSFEHIPDLIISDIMMPKLDGFQMCSRLKTDPRTSHIPIIMLTAKAAMKDKINGLETGADEYLIKPFEAEELKARIKNLLEQRKRMHEHFRRYGLVDFEGKNITAADQKFLQKVFVTIEQHLSEEKFGVEKMAELLAMSRSLLFKKLSALVGESPIDLIKRTRLNKAAKLIENRFGNISEVAFEVGFNNPSYFAECFRKQFGVTPSQYQLKSEKK